jgi:hypothetical protein
VKVPVLHNVKKTKKPCSLENLEKTLQPGEPGKNLAAWRTLEVLQYLFRPFSVVSILYLKMLKFLENYLPMGGLKFCNYEI